MSEKTSEIADQFGSAIGRNLTRYSVVPFTGGIIMFLYAFFWPEGYGHWLGTIVRAFRQAAGL